MNKQAIGGVGFFLGGLTLVYLAYTGYLTSAWAGITGKLNADGTAAYPATQSSTSGNVQATRMTNGSAAASSGSKAAGNADRDLGRGNDAAGEADAGGSQSYYYTPETGQLYEGAWGSTSW